MYVGKLAFGINDTAVSVTNFPFELMWLDYIYQTDPSTTIATNQSVLVNWEATTPRPMPTVCVFKATGDFVWIHMGITELTSDVEELDMQALGKEYTDDQMRAFVGANITDKLGVVYNIDRMHDRGLFQNSAKYNTRLYVLDRAGAVFNLNDTYALS